uniref:Single Ig and TIR domain containing n=1 Tax=Gopherus evgoodei TaxID=1825980 RepID=A0A8C4Y4V5_9SAUR
MPGGKTCAPPEVLVPSSNQTLEPALGSQITLNCTVRLPSQQHCNPVLHWMKDGHWLGDESSPYASKDKVWVGDNGTETFMSSLLGVNLTSDEDYGVFACWVKNTTATFTLQRSGTAGHVSAVLAALFVLGLLLLMAVIYVKCRLNMLLWYRNRYGELEINDGKLYDAYVSYANSPDDRKFVNFIMKPQLENRHGYKLFLDDKTILPNAEPSADLIMNVSRCRRLIVVLSYAYLEQDWCINNFRDGLLRLLELSQRPIFVAFESQYRKIEHLAINLLKQHKNAVTLLLWRAGSVTPSSDFWKELCLALPRKMSYQGIMADPQTQLQEDKDPMLILHSSDLEYQGDPHPDGDLGTVTICLCSYIAPIWEGGALTGICPKGLGEGVQDLLTHELLGVLSLIPHQSVLSIPTGVRGSILRGPPPPRMTGPNGPPALAAGITDEVQLEEGQRSEIDISDLGSRNYGARTDFYCLVTEDDL